MYFLGIDAGASATKWSLIDESGIVASGTQEAMDGHLYRDASKIRMDSVLDEIEKGISGKKVDRIYMGITGVVHDGSIEKYLQKYFAAPSIVVSDIELAYRANFIEGNGILLYAGTGSVAYAIDEKGEIHQIGGWGYLLGDEGAGYWIGREAIRHALYLIESKSVASPGSLGALILKEINANDWNSVKGFVYSQDRSAVAALSRIVDQAALKGDKSAIEILNKAAGHLADLIDRTDRNLLRKSLPIKFTGGISSSVSLYRELEKFLRMRVSISTVDIAHRAAELARS
jgi:N-acetylglucosamine kinase-like BadF-type ATPase